MIKNFLACFLFFVSITAFSQELSITNNLPTSASAGVGIQADFTLTKGANMGSFAKFQIDVPSGFMVESIEIKGGNFTFENNRAKIVWVSLPGDNSFTFTLKIVAPSNASGSVTFAPQFFYLENNVKKDYSPAASTISYSGGSVVDNTGNGNVTPVPNSTTDNNSSTSDNTASSSNSAPATTDNNTSSSTTETPAATSNTSTTDNTTPATTSNTTSAPAETAKTTSRQPPAARSNVMYHVQVYALSIKPNKAKFAEYGLIKVVEENGLYKVLVGSFKTLEEARKYKASLLAKGVAECFVVAYENGVRVKI